MRIGQALLDRVVAHARREFPNECCGLVVLRDGLATEVVEAENQVASPYRFQIDGRLLSRRLFEVEDRGEQLAVYHSHTRSDPYPSQTDANFARGWPGVEWLIVGLRDGEPEVRSFLIDGERVSEVDVEVVGGDG
jgi:proteasome lid subunit RPN8/RPN11